LDVPGLVKDESSTQADIIQGTTFVVGILSTWGIQHKYLDGWSKWESGVLDVEALKQAPAAGSDYDDSYDDYDEDAYYDDSYDDYDDSYEPEDYESYAPYDVDPATLERQDGEYYDRDAERA
jgi:hypothetical protein